MDRVLCIVWASAQFGHQLNSTEIKVQFNTIRVVAEPINISHDCHAHCGIIRCQEKNKEMTDKALYHNTCWRTKVPSHSMRNELFNHKQQQIHSLRTKPPAFDGTQTQKRTIN